MLKFFTLLFFVTLGLILPANAVSNNKIEVTSTSLTTTKNIVYANDGVVVYYDNSVINATRATYNKETKLLILDGDVEMIGYLGTKEHTSHMEIKTDTKEVIFEKLFLTSENDIWLLSEKAHRLNGNYTFGRSMLSSCDVDDPLWKMVFSNAKYNSEDEYMKLYHAKVYFWDVPIFYTPYLAFSTNKQRSSGLLFPLFGYVANEGLVYEQPIFWDISPSMDLEINPQIRTRRSVGAYSTFRFVDSNYSSGKFRAGYFQDSKSYQKREKTKEREHYGVEFLYDSSKVFSSISAEDKSASSKTFKDGLFVDLTYLNNVEYLYLQKRPIHFGLNPIQESKVNYFLHNDRYYMGMNAKYFIDTRKKNNENTLQILPALQLHKYLESLIWDNLTYSIDLQTSNFDRKKGTTAKQTELKIPLDFSMSFFDDYLNVSLSEEFYYSKHFFGNGTFTYNDFQYYNNIHKAAIFTDLTKKYTHFVHVMQPSIKYMKPGSENEDPVNLSELSSTQKPFITAGLPEEEYGIGFNQYIYGDKKTNLIFFQRFYQKYYPNREYKWSDVGNEMLYNWKKWGFYNNLVYAPEFSKMREVSSGISLKEKAYKFSLLHTYKKVLKDQLTARPANDIAFDFSYTYNDKIGIFGGVSYEIDKSTSREWRLGGSYSRDCWGITGSIRQDIVPTSKGGIKRNAFYLQFDFRPFATVGIDKQEEIE